MNKQKKYSDKELMKMLQVDSKTLERFKKIQQETIAEAKKMNHRKNKKIKVLGISGSARDQFDMAQEKSNSETLLEKCLKDCESLGAATELISLRKYLIKNCKACYSTVNTQCHFYCSCYPKNTPESDDMTNTLYDKILEADAIIFATPVNNFKISSLMATFIDRCISLDGSLQPADPKATKNKNLNYKHLEYIKLTADENIPGSGFLRRFSGKVAGIIVTGHEAGAAMAISSLFLTLGHYGMIFPPFSNMYAMSSVCLSTNEDKKVVLSECYLKDANLLAQNIVKAVSMAKNVAPFDWKVDPTAN